MGRRRYVDGPHGQVHLAEAGPTDGPAVLLLHQTPRSWREFAAVLDLLAERGLRAVAMDTPGMGGSDAPPGTPRIEDYAAAAVAVLGAVTDGPAAVVGHHTGGVIAVEVAAQAPDRVTALVLSSTPWVDAERRERVATRPPIDAVEPRPDGTHLAELWQRRQAFYPEGRTDLLHAFVGDALRVGVGEDLEAGHRAVNAYRMEERVGLLRARALVLGATDDPFAWPERDRLAEVLRGHGLEVTTAAVEGGMVPLPDQLPDAFAGAVTDYLGEAWPA